MLCPAHPQSAVPSAPTPPAPVPPAPAPTPPAQRMSDTFYDIDEQLSVYYDAPEHFDESAGEDQDTEGTPGLDIYYSYRDEGGHFTRFNLPEEYEDPLVASADYTENLILAAAAADSFAVKELLGRPQDCLSIQRTIKKIPAVLHMGEHAIGRILRQWQVPHAAATILATLSRNMLRTRIFDTFEESVHSETTTHVLTCIDGLLLLACQGFGWCVDVSLCRSYDSFSFAVCASRAPREAFVATLLDAGANPTAHALMPEDCSMTLVNPISVGESSLRYDLSHRRRNVLQLASAWASEELVNRLIAGGADVNVAMPFTYSEPTGEEEYMGDGVTPLHVAATYANAAAVRALLAAGADPTACDEKGRSPLHWAMRQSSWMGEFWGAEARKHKNVENDTETETETDSDSATDNYYWWAPQLDIVRLILDSGKADLTAADRDGYTVLHYAARAGLLGAVALLISHGADATTLSARGESVFHMLAEAPPFAVFSTTDAHELKRIRRTGYTEIHGAVLDMYSLGEVKRMLGLRFKGRTAADRTVRFRDERLDLFACLRGVDEGHE